MQAILNLVYFFFYLQLFLPFKNIPTKNKPETEMKSKQVQNPEHVEVSQEQTSYRPSSSSNSLPSAHQGRKILFPHHTKEIQSPLTKRRKCLVLIPSPFQISLLKLLKNNSTKYFFPYKPLNKQKYKEKNNCNWEGTIRPIHFIHLY